MRGLFITTLLVAGCSGEGVPAGEDPASPGSDPGGPGGGGTDPGVDPSGGSWLATYDLTGSKFFIDAMVDFTITVQEPYDADTNTGPGRIVLRFPDVDGAMGPGAVSLVEYQLTWDFVTGVGGFADVHTDIENQAGPEACGVASGTLAGADLAWTPAQMDPLCQVGEISCTGPFCGTSGAPPADQPEVVDECDVWGINAFTFSADLATFDMAPAMVSSDADTETAMQFHGTLVDSVFEDAPGCP